jgi:hypothetical protein
MNIIKRLFGGTTMQAVEQPTESEIAERLAVVERQLASGEGDIARALEERERLRYQLDGARIVREKRESEAYRANNEAKSVGYRARLTRCAECVADLTPRLLWALQELEALEKESYNIPIPDFDKTGIPFGFAADARRALHAASSGIEWHYDFLSDPSKRNPLPQPKIFGIRLPPAAVTDVLGNPAGTRYQ